KAVDNSYNYSENALSLSFTGSINPSQVTNFLASQNGSNVLLTWDKSTDTDIVCYEIREGKNWETGSLVITGLTYTTYEFPVSYENTYYYRIKAKNRAGNYSTVSSFASVVISDLPPINVIEAFDELSLKSGTYSNTVFGTSQYTFDTVISTLADYPSTSWEDFGGLNVLRLAKNSSNLYYSSGTYTTAEKDLGQNTTCNISIDYYANTTLESSDFSANLQYKIKLNNGTYSDWQDYVGTIQKTFRYFQARVNILTNDTTKSPQISVLRANLDVPDVDKYGTTTVAVGGSTIKYGYTFYNNPAVLPTALGAGLRTELQSVDTSSFVVKVLNTSNTDVGGTISWFAKGF
ncbi:MAG: fibronectin type III domain-containing protein, partial [Candidatus Gastranaerophilaceae bacterium]